MTKILKQQLVGSEQNLCRLARVSSNCANGGSDREHELGRPQAMPADVCDEAQELRFVERNDITVVAACSFRWISRSRRSRVAKTVIGKCGQQRFLKLM